MNTSEYTANTPPMYQMYFLITEYRQIDTKYIKYTDFEIHFRFFSQAVKMKNPEKVSGTEITFLLGASIACVVTLRHFPEKLYLLIQLRASIAFVRTLLLFQKKAVSQAAKLAGRFPDPFI